MDCGLLRRMARGSGSSTRGRRSLKFSLKQQLGSMKRRSEEQHAAETDRDWPADASRYQLLGVAGRGAHAVVHRARCLDFGEGEGEVAIKCLDLDASWDLTALIREATLLKRIRHPAVLPLHAAFVAGKELWLVTPFFGLGSVRSIMKEHSPSGLDEVVIASIMRPVLSALQHLHAVNCIHRDVKADNILVSHAGQVVLADFGVAAARTRAVSMVNLAGGMPGLLATTFVGTPCWMAPEVMQQADGYHCAADIWSVGITLMELARGRPPLARMHPLRVMTETMSSKPAPTLDGDGQQHSRALREVVEACLQKDPSERPTAAALLEHRFFRLARDAQFLQAHWLAGLAPPEDPPLPLQPQPQPRAPPQQQQPQPQRRPEQQPRVPAAPEGRCGSVCESVPSGSGPSRKGSSWVFPSFIFARGASAALGHGGSCQLQATVPEGHDEESDDEPPARLHEGCVIVSVDAGGKGDSGGGLQKS